MFPTSATRNGWLEVLERLARPVLENLAGGELRLKMPVETRPGAANRANFSHFEAVARLLCGIAPWLELESDQGQSENALRAEFRELAARGLGQAVNPDSPDYLNFHDGGQPLVEIGFLSQAILRAPRTLFGNFDEATQNRLRAAISSSRTRKPGFNNWLLFCGIAEAALGKIGVAPDLMRLDYALRQHESWYLGDGIYGDGPQFHADNYNAFVIQPMLVDIFGALGPNSEWETMRDAVWTRARRFAAIQERMISPEGTFPPLGRSLCYRFGALQGLSQAALLGNLPPEISPASARCALTRVMERLIEAPSTFDSGGWLRLGFCGAQPDLAEPYISTGSLYLCSVGLLPLGLPSSDEFWSAPDAKWTSQRLWNGEDLPADHAI